MATGPTPASRLDGWTICVSDSLLTVRRTGAVVPGRQRRSPGYLGNVGADVQGLVPGCYGLQSMTSTYRITYPIGGTLRW